MTTDEQQRLRGASLIHAVVRAGRISLLLGPGTVRRALADSGVDPEQATARDYRLAMPHLEARLNAYLKGEALDAALHRIRALVRRLEA